MAEYWVDLGIRGAKVLQDSDGYTFSQDSVLVANLAKLKAGDSVLDLGSGVGTLLFIAKLKKHVGKAVGIEIDPHAVDMARRSAESMSLDAEFLLDDVRNIRSALPVESFDAVLCNPPYFRTDSPSSDNISKRLARTESASLEDFIAAAAYALRFGGDMWITMKATRLASLIHLLKLHSLEPKQLILIYPKRSKGADSVIVGARKGGKEGLTLSDLIVMDEDGKYTPEFSELYK